MLPQFVKTIWWEQSLLVGNELDPVAPGIENVTAGCPGQFDSIADGNASFVQSRQKLRVIAATQGWMRLGRWVKIVIYANVNLDCAALEPASAALGEFGRLANFDHSEQITKEFSGRVFFAGGHGQLHVIDRAKGSVVHL